MEQALVSQKACLKALNAFFVLVTDTPSALLHPVKPEMLDVVMRTVLKLLANKPAQNLRELFPKVRCVYKAALNLEKDVLADLRMNPLDEATPFENWARFEPNFRFIDRVTGFLWNTDSFKESVEFRMYQLFGLTCVLGMLCKQF